MTKWQHRLHEIIFEADTKEGKLFDVVLLVLIMLSIIGVMLDSVPSIHNSYANTLFITEWVFTIIFTIEYLLRIISVKKPISYITSFYGVIDLISTLPSYLSLFIPGSQVFRVLRSLRLLRVFKVLKMPQFTGASNSLAKALKASRPKIVVFLVAVLALAMIMGTIMYIVEGGEHGFTSIPRSMYWAIVTLTTVGYGDISPETPLGQFIASIIMILGYGIIAVPTGIVSSEIAKTSGHKYSTQACPNCMKEEHEDNALYCSNCGYKLNDF